MVLKNGYYEPVRAKKVTHWPEPDADGDGAEVWDEKYDSVGNRIGRQQRKDEQGRVVKEYNPPDGFINVPTREPGGDGQRDNYVKANARGDVWRHPQTEEAVSIRPGQTLVEHADGTVEVLADDYSRFLFERSHQETGDPGLEDLDSSPEEQDSEMPSETEMAEFRAWKQSQQTEFDNTSVIQEGSTAQKAAKQASASTRSGKKDD